MFRAASAGTKLSVLVLFGYTRTALNADAMLDFCPFMFDKDQLYYCKNQKLCISEWIFKKRQENKLLVAKIALVSRL